jgi:hypothetical protein
MLRSRTVRRGILALALVVTACTPDTATSTTVELPQTSTTSAPGTTTSTITDGTIPPITRPDLSGLEGLSVGVREQLADLIVAAQGIRGLPLLTVPEITVLAQPEFEARILGLLEESSQDIPADQPLYQLLGLIAPEADLEEMFTALYTEQVAGFYDEGEIVVPAREDGLSILQQGSLLHEMVHALTDQHFEFDSFLQQMLDDKRYDEVAAYRAFAEGDASLAEVMWIRTLSQRELGEFIAESLDIDTSVLDSMPRFIRDSLVFPYESGLFFVQALQSSGGWDAVNQAYLDMPDLPGSTEQILTPGDYGRDLPAAVPVIDVEVPGYELTVTSVWGELSLRLMLDQGLGEANALPAADGWGGDFYHQWFDGQNAALLMVYVGDTAEDLEELRTALLSYAADMVDEEDFVWVDEEGGLLYFILADEEPVGESIRSAVGLG